MCMFILTQESLENISMVNMNLIMNHSMLENNYEYENLRTLTRNKNEKGIYKKYLLIERKIYNETNFEKF